MFEIFAALGRHNLTVDDGRRRKTFQLKLTSLQRQVLDLLDIPASAYTDP